MNIGVLSATFSRRSLAEFLKAGAHGYHGQIPTTSLMLFGKRRIGVVEYSSDSDQAPFLYAVVSIMDHGHHFVTYYPTQLSSLRELSTSMRANLGNYDMLIIRMGVAE